MDRHRRQSHTRPPLASLIGDSRHSLFTFFTASPDLFAAPFCHSFSRSLSWNS
ncbi:protein YoaL [Leclercia adecarboxylata]|uniref:protein YoaL n=1 Tax=Leclercia adecarboxylata TaxID=83655 RepID=UPI003AF32DB5